MVEGRSKQASETWLSEREQSWRDGVEVVAMDGFTGFKTVTTEELPDAVAVVDPFHVVLLGRRRTRPVPASSPADQREDRGRKDDPLYRARPTLHTDKQKDRLHALLANEAHVEVEATWGIYQRMIAAYREPDRAKGRRLRRRSPQKANGSTSIHAADQPPLGHPTRPPTLIKWRNLLRGGAQLM